VLYALASLNVLIVLSLFVLFFIIVFSEYLKIS